jgi:hypothetical protein
MWRISLAVLWLLVTFAPVDFEAAAQTPASLLVPPDRLELNGPRHQEIPSFLNDVEPILTRLGCNQGACHGKGTGQNGFRLSLRGYAPEWDHDWITREFASRRVNLAVPEDSLFLKKPLGQVPHEGGRLMRPGSREHQVMLDWIRAQAPGPLAQEPLIRRLEILPSSRVMKPGEQQLLLVRAEYSDGHWRDVTWLTQFHANDASVATVSEAGLVKVERAGETAIRAAFQGLVAVAVITVPHETPVPRELLAKKNNFIDEHVFGKLAALRIEPSGLCSDEVFLRRVYLDAIGVLPTPRELREFLADQAPDKRSALIDQLLERLEYIDYQTMILDELLQNRKESDHDVRGPQGVQSFHDYLWDQVAANRPWDELARDVLTVTGKADESPAVGYFIVTVGENRETHKSSVVASVAQTFLGTRIGCAQCHNHPLEKYTQDDYYHFAGFFTRVKLDRKDPKKGVTSLLVEAADSKQNKSPVGVVQPRTGKFLRPQTLDRLAPPINPGDDARVELVNWMTDPGNEYFAGAMVNRLWAHFFGIGLVEPIDDLRSSNPPTNPALWNALIKEFVDHAYDRKHMMRLIMNSRTYQLASETRPANEKDFHFFSHYYARRLPAEALLDAICQATGVPDTFPGYPYGQRAVQIPDPALKSYFLSLFGRSERISACACERTGDVTMPQLMHLRNGDSVVSKIGNAAGRLSRLLKWGKKDADIVDELFLTTLSRFPSAVERARMQAELSSGDSREMVLRDLFWALLNAKEFSFNH